MFSMTSTNGDGGSAAAVLTERIPLDDDDAGDDEGGREVLVVTLNRPRKKNCFNTRLCRELSTIFFDAANEIEGYDRHDGGEAASPEQKRQRTKEKRGQLAAIILTGAGKSFCAGADLSDPPSPLRASMDLPEHLRWNPVHQMSRVGVPILGALRGHVITGGFEIALACDILLGDDTTSFRDTHVKFGLAPCWGLSQNLARRIGPGRAKVVSFSALPVTADVAHEWGLLDELVTTSDDGTAAANDNNDNSANPVLERAIELAASISRNNPLMVRRYKRAMVEGGRMSHGEGLRRERELGLAHYLEIVGDGTTMEGAKEFIEDDSRRKSKL